jgi:hypothetical protein
MKARMQAAATVCMLVASGLIRAYDLTPNASLSAIFTDNTMRSSSSEQSAAVMDAAAGFLFFDNTSALVADISATYLYRYYVDDVLPPVQLPNAVGTVTWNMIPQYVSWMFEDEFGQVAPSPFFALSPAGLQDVNYATTGPSVTIPIGRAENIRVGGTYSSVNYQDSDTDFTGASGYVGLAHSFSKSLEASLNYVRQQVSFEHDDLYPNYVEQSAFVRLSSNVHVMSLVLDAGEASIESAQGPRYTRPVVDLTAYRQVGAITTVGVDVGERFSDSAGAFRFDELSGTLGSSSANVLVDATPYVGQNAGAFISIDGPRQSFRLTLSHDTRNPLGPIQNYQRIEYAELSDEYRINARDSITASLRYEQDFSRVSTGEQSVDFSSAGIKFVHPLSRNTQVTVSVDRYEARGTYAFNEDRVGVYLSYAPQPKRPRALITPYRGRGLPLPPSTVEGSIGGAASDVGTGAAQ